MVDDDDLSFCAAHHVAGAIVEAGMRKQSDQWHK
jgi:cation transport regulator ChaB